MSKDCKRLQKVTKILVICRTMNVKPHYKSIALIMLLGIIWVFINFKNTEEASTEDIKIALRDVGHKILLTNKDSLSMVLPVKELNELQYNLTFEEEFSIRPDNLVTIINNSFRKSNLPRHYIIEVINCTDQEVAYSYKMQNEQEESIIPCGTRTITKGCYTLEAKFMGRKSAKFYGNIVLAIIGLLFLNIIWITLKNKKTPKKSTLSIIDERLNLGNYEFFPNQNKLTLKGKDIQLSKKEGDLLTILIANLNQVVKREDLTKKVWEDNGVVVGRSLDTYISKLRKKLKEDSTIKISNIHGVGYKLESLK